MASTLETCANTAARPASPSAGDTLYQIDTKQIITYDGSAWRVYNSDGSVGYDLDGTRILSVAPILHLDAEKVNGADASGNPSNAAAFTGQWVSLYGNNSTLAQGTAGKQPTYYTSGENSKAYLDFDGGDDLFLTERLYLQGDFTAILIGQSGGGNFSPWGTSGKDFSDASFSPISTLNLGGAGIFTGRTNDILMFYNDSSPSGYPGISSHPTGKDFHSETRNLIFKRTGSAASLFFDGDNTSATASSTSYADIRVGDIGRDWYLSTTGKIYEMIVFNSALSDADLNIWNAYVTARYAAGTGAMEAQDDF